MIGHYYCLSRILSIPCKVCGDFSSGKHYNIFACDGCAGFFKRSIRSNRQYICRAARKGTCVIDKTHRNQCRACRLKKCQEAGMNKDAVQHERGSRKSTVRAQENANHISSTSKTIAQPDDDNSEGLRKRVPPSKTESYTGASKGLYLKTPVTYTELTTPTLAPPLLAPTDLCEAAAQLLFMNVQWVKTITSFTTLPLPDQLLLLEESWRDLFILGTALFLPFVELPSLLTASVTCHSQNPRPFLLERVREFHHVLGNLRRFRMDQNEFACLRAIAFFTTTVSKGERTLSDATTVAAVQESTKLKLRRYVGVTYPNEPMRCERLLVLLPTVRNVLEETIEELFFRNTIGHVPIVSIISDMYKTHCVRGLTTPTLAPPLLAPTDLCEAAAQLLFMNVQWVKTVTSFTTLPIPLWRLSARRADYATCAMRLMADCS
ncbi:hypothetical protein NQ318_005397, partial [Aromia moschata]